MKLNLKEGGPGGERVSVVDIFSPCPPHEELQHGPCGTHSICLIQTKEHDFCLLTGATCNVQHITAGASVASACLHCNPGTYSSSSGACCDLFAVFAQLGWHGIYVQGGVDQRRRQESVLDSNHKAAH